MRMFWIGLLIGLVAMPPALLVAAAWYMLGVPGRSHHGALPGLTPEERDLAGRLRAHVVAIASEPHNIGHDEAVERAARHIERALEGLAYSIDRQVFSVRGSEVRNIEATREPRDTPAADTLIVGAHYDSFEDSPGANDNATGTAAVLELARLLERWQPRQTRLRFVLFVNEEPPYFMTRDMGSLRYAEALAARKERVTAMFSLETLGCYSDAPGSQKYPFPFGLMFPDRGDFVAFVGLTHSRPLVQETMRSFRSHTSFPTVGGVAPGIIPGIGWSDHWAFGQHGFQGVMVTDTAPFRYPHYHEPTDTPDKVDTERLARVVKGMERVVRDLVR